MISTSISSTSDYYSSSDLDYDDDDDVVKAASQRHSSTKKRSTILQTLLQHHHYQSPSSSSSTKKIHHSIRLLKLVRDNHLSEEVFIRANTILHKFLLSTCSNDVDESILVACLSLATKLTEHSNHFTITLFSSHSLICNENLICNALNWDIDMITPINYIEAILLHVTDCSITDRLRQLCSELIVLCLIDVRCMGLSVVWVGMSCLLMACELLNCCEIVPQQVFEYDEDKESLFETSLIYIRQVLMNILRR